MKTSHGSLENEIMNAIWTIEENYQDIESLNISVGDVVDFINKNSTKKAYTTVKTVMDRLVDKKQLERIKSGKKFYYTPNSGRREQAERAILKLAGQYFNNDIHSLIKAVECLKK